MKLKVFIAALLFGGYGVAYKVLYPVMNNHQALKQLEDTQSSFTNYALYQQAWDYGWAVIVLITLLIFRTEIMGAVKQLKREEENKNE